jgi:putative Holliday junction resolvase
VRPGVRLGVDVGSVRIGVARSDPGGLLASPLDTVRRGSGDVAALARLAAENDAVEIVVGLAVGLGGLVDERFTTVLAHAALQQGGQDSRARRESVDKAAAALLLQGALDAERATGEPAGQLVGAAAGGATL